MSNLTKAQFDVVISSIIEEPAEEQGHPFLTVAKFVFADDRPNGNKQAVDYSEFENIKRSAIGMPVKMRFDGIDVGDHGGSIPIGVIRSIEEATGSDDSHQLIAEALLWKEEYPEEVEFLKAAFASGDAPGISYELGYADSETKNGVQWIKRVVTLAATFVKNPAYGKRTRLLALASDEVTKESLITEIMEASEKKGFDVNEIIQGLQQLLTPPNEGNPDEGGNQMEEELEKQKAMAASLQSQIEDLQAQLAAKDSEIEAKNEEVKQLQFAALIDSRTRKFVEAGFNLEADAEKAEKKKALWASLSDEQFEDYLSDLVDAKKSAAGPAPTSPALAAIALASQQSAMPRPEAPDATDLSGLKAAMKHLARPNSIE